MVEPFVTFYCRFLLCDLVDTQSSNFGYSPATEDPAISARDTSTVLIIGAGMGGLAAAIRLAAAGR
ncbi:hypothetical protein, partial [Acidiphilium multivorum]|uniref:hypothetical protein n=1 Tax=Acidiphilium multivorum TaxID=62140 RepID=UPI001F26F6EF